jgi:hypothetical protein
MAGGVGYPSTAPALATAAVEVPWVLSVIATPDRLKVLCVMFCEHRVAEVFQTSWAAMAGGSSSPVPLPRPVGIGRRGGVGCGSPAVCVRAVSFEALGSRIAEDVGATVTDIQELELALAYLHAWEMA